MFIKGYWLFTKKELDRIFAEWSMSAVGSRSNGYVQIQDTAYNWCDLNIKCTALPFRFNRLKQYEDTLRLFVRSALT